MPKNKSAKIDDRRQEARSAAKARTPKLEKMARYPASMNQINKNLP